MLRERDHPAPPSPLDLDWQLFAACSELEVEESDPLFFAGQGQSRLANRARAICAVCIVRAECLAFALENCEASEYGITWRGYRSPRRVAPARRICRLGADSVGLALLIVLETLTPAERLAFVLHDMFDLPFDEIAPMIDRSPEAARQLASRARGRVKGADVPASDPERVARIAAAILTEG